MPDITFDLHAHISQTHPVFRQRRSIVLLIVLLTVMDAFFGLVTVQSEDTPVDCIPAQGEPIQIGGVLPTGTIFSSKLGEPLNGVTMMIEAFNACGGVNGRPITWRHIAAVNRTEAQAAIETLIAEQISIVIGSGTPAVGEVLTEIAEREQIVFWEVSEGLLPTQQSAAWTFSPRPTHRQIGSRAAEYIQTDLSADLNLEEIQLALIYEERIPAQEIAGGLRTTLNTTPVIDLRYSNVLQDTRTLGAQIRDRDANVLVSTSFNEDADTLWYNMREADANVAAWIHIGNEGYREGMCSRIGNSEGFISIGAGGPVSEDFRSAMDTAIYRQYLHQHQLAFDRAPVEREQLSASGMYTLLRDVLPNVDDYNSAKAIRTTILETKDTHVGLMGYGFAVTSEPAVNASASIIVQQRQDGVLCSTWPSAIVTCNTPVQPFPTWRQRVLASEREGCYE